MSEEETKKTDGQEEFDPEDFRMSLGDHLEELRSRLLKGLGGFILAAIVCLIFGERVIAIFCKPLTDGLRKAHLNPTLIATTITESFTTYMNVSLICAAAISAPWMLYQLWLFIAAGLYTHERKTVTKYMPMSIILLIAGMLFLYFVVLPITVNFLIHFTINMKSIEPDVPKVTPTTQEVMKIPLLPGDPEKPFNGQIWYDTTQSRLKMWVNDERVSFQNMQNSLVSPMITIGPYINLVVLMLIMFGVAFQMPLVVLAIARLGLVDIPTLKKARRIVYFLIAILCAVIVPDVVTGMLALMAPMILLYELGVWMAARAIRRAEAEAAADQAEIDREL
jgi:sec-independent protein translocase protein TatC